MPASEKEDQAVRATNNGGPAFPVSGYVDPNTGGYEGASFGMSLHDWYAGQALIGLLSGPTGSQAAEGARNNPGHAAAWAMEFADAILAERECRQEARP